MDIQIGLPENLIVGRAKSISGRAILSVLLALVVGFRTVFPCGGGERGDLLDRSLYRLVEGLKQDPATRGMVVGYEAVSLDRGEVMASLRAEKTFVPGSVLQLLTGAAVLDAMPEGMRIPTEVYVDGVLASGGTLKGDIILKGYGDPSLNANGWGIWPKRFGRRGFVGCGAIWWWMIRSLTARGSERDGCGMMNPFPSVHRSEPCPSTAIR